MKNAIVVLYSVLIFGVPLIFFPKTSELFEFNKIVFLYAVSLIISTLWIIECVVEKKFVFKRTFLDIPLSIFVLSQFISTIFSIDTRTSIFGYYSRFNGGLLSILCYAILYFAFTSHVARKDLPRMAFNAFVATSIAALWGTLEHFGKSPSCALITGNFDVGCWVQDVQLRVFATFGQPNWMAAWMAALTPLTFAIFFDNKTNQKTKIIHIILSVLFTAALLFTKSKSGIAAFGVSMLIFVLLIAFYRRSRFKELLFKKLLLASFAVILTALVFGTPWTPSVSGLVSVKNTEPLQLQSGTSLETGGTDSGIIRTIVWEGALKVWKQFPIFGSGVETFAFSYYRGRPMSHNMVSEWNFLYNKAHNEYLNFLATTGMVGLLAYLGAVGASLFQMWRVLKKKVDTSDFYIVVALLAGYLSILITNFFGFSVVPISVLFYVFPAASIAILNNVPKKEMQTQKPTGTQMVVITIALFMSVYISILLINYWRSDYLYARGQEAFNNEDYSGSLSYYKDAIALSPNEALYHAQLGSLYADLTTAKEADKSMVETFVTASTHELTEASSLSPQNVRILKSLANSYATLGDTNSEYLTKTLELTQILTVLAPTDPSVLYQQCLTLAKMNQMNDAIKSCEDAIGMKPDYKIARRLIAFLYETTKKPEKAVGELQYILKNISPDDEAVKKELQSLQGK